MRERICKECGGKGKWRKFARGMCPSCYNKWFRKSELYAKVLEKRTKCSENECNELEFRKGLCSSHYWKWYRKSDQFKQYEKKRTQRLGGCSICGKTIKCGGLCATHYNHKKEGLVLKRLQCGLCGKEFLQKKKNQEYCTKECSLLNDKIKRTLRTRLCKIIKYSGKKSGSAVRDLGCSIKKLKDHLETRFKPGMNWENHGMFGWHIDHILPLSNFNLSNSEEFKKACHYTNLQPLWAKENLNKATKMNYKIETNKGEII